MPQSASFYNYYTCAIQTSTFSKHITELIVQYIVSRMYVLHESFIPGSQVVHTEVVRYDVMYSNKQQVAGVQNQLLRTRCSDARPVYTRPSQSSNYISITVLYVCSFVLHLNYRTVCIRSESLFLCGCASAAQIYLRNHPFRGIVHTISVPTTRMPIQHTNVYNNQHANISVCAANMPYDCCRVEFWR